MPRTPPFSDPGRAVPTGGPSRREERSGLGRLGTLRAETSGVCPIDDAPQVDPHPPILFGGSGKGLLRIAAREADVVNVIVDTGRAGTVLASEIAKLSEDGFRAKLDFVRREAKVHGREPTLSTTIFVMAITDKSEEAAQIASGVAAGFGLAAEGVQRVPIALVGTAGECAEELRRREREWGISHVIVSGASGLPLIERFAAEVLPRL